MIPNFNSSQVRLELVKSSTDVRIVIFQFQLGTIGTFLDASLVYTLSYFNSSQVRLEHTGLVFCIAFDEFQFQLGTIGTTLPDLTSLKLINFNSSQVRLELILLIWISVSAINFNSSQVRLELVEKSRMTVLMSFQFQLGTIGTIFNLLHKRSDVISIPVRYDWNDALKQATREENNFNSSQVRLERQQVSNLIAEELFQFQLGTIGTETKLHAIIKQCISIPVRCDWNFPASASMTFLYKFQFQLGTIGTLLPSSLLLLPLISIPVRYDWNLIWTKSRLKFCNFNSSQVRLELVPQVRQSLAL